MGDWATTTLGDLVELQRGHDLPSTRRRSGKIPVIGSFGVTGFHDEALYAGPGVAIGRSGASFGRATYVPGEYWPLNTCLFVRDFRGNDARWIYHLLTLIDFEGFNSGSAQPSLNRNFLKSIAVSVPPIEEQRAIADVLGALDDKIAANTRLASLADELVRADWGRVVNETEGTLPLGRFATAVRHQVEPAQLAAGTAYVGLEHIPRRSMWLDALGNASGVTSSKSRFVRGDVLFGKLRPYFHKVVSAPCDGICSTDIIAMRAYEPVLMGFVLAAAASDQVVDLATASSEGTRMPRTSWQDLARVEVAWPGVAAAREFSSRVIAIRDAAEARVRETQGLATMRDALLPALMSGRLRVRDAEAAVRDSL